jgi:Protein of unknown function (DUF3618)
MASQDQAPKAVGQGTTIQEIEQARDDLARTIDAITDKVRPANVARRATDQLRERVQAQAVDLRRRVQPVDPRLVAGGVAVVVAGVVALVVWRRRR